MTWIDRINQRDSYLGAPDLPDGWSRVAEAMGGLADDDCLGCDPAGLGIDLEGVRLVRQIIHTGRLLIGGFFGGGDDGT